MSFLLASLILIIPLVEIWILIQIGIAASLNAVFILCVISAGAGWRLMRGEDFSIWTLIETELQNRRLPTEELLSDFLT
jgi:Protein affecting phage T7 exclusion by the F plasmid